MSKISELSDGGVIQGGDTLIAVRSGGNVKVTYGGSTTANIDGGTIDGTVIGGTTAAAGSFTTISASGEIAANGGVAFGDNDKATFGAGSDLQIYHDGSNSYVTDAGTGNLVIGADTFTYIGNPAGTTTAARFNAGGAQVFNHNNSQKLSTTATGIDVTGTVTADTATIGSGSGALINTTADDLVVDNAGSGGITVASGAAQYGNLFFSDSGSSVAGYIQYLHGTDYMRFGTATNERLRISSGGDISFYEDTGTTAKFFWDASAESLGIGTSSPESPIDINRSSTDGTIATFRKDGTSVGSIGTNSNTIYIDGFSANTGIQFAGSAWVPRDSGAFADNTVDVGTSTYRLKDLYLSGLAYTNGIVATDVDIVIQNSADGIYFGSGFFRPYSADDTVISLGSSTSRFKDLYLSGGVYLGGTGAANLLDDYEEGVIQVTLNPSTSGTITLEAANDELSYTKIGRQVTITGWLIVASVSSPVGGSLTFSLPFTVANLSNTSGGFGGMVAQNTSGAYVPTAVEANENATTAIINLDASTVGAGGRFKFSFSYFGA